MKFLLKAFKENIFCAVFSQNEIPATNLSADRNKEGSLCFRMISTWGRVLIQ